MLQLLKYFFTKHLIYKQNILINFTFSKNYASFTWVRMLENTSLHLCEIEITYREGHFLQQNKQME
jgi:hypothetical protein